MKKYEEEHYLYDNIKDQIYPWVSSTLSLPETLNGKNISEKDTPLIEFVCALKILFVIKRGEETYEVIKDNLLPPECDIPALYHHAYHLPELKMLHTWYYRLQIPRPAPDAGCRMWKPCSMRKRWQWISCRHCFAIQKQEIWQ